MLTSPSRRTTTSRLEGRPEVRFAHFAQAWVRHHQEALSAAGGEQVRDVCDVGGGANPLLAPDEVEASGVRCTVLDVSADELRKAPAGYATEVLDLCAGPPPEHLRGGFDLVVSKMTAEHVPDARAFHRSVHALLRPGGTAMHFFPTLWTLPLVVNLALPEAVGAAILRRLHPRDAHQEAKFVAHYDWCRGPGERQFRRLRSTGFEVVAYEGYFGHSYYDRVPPLDALEQAKAGFLVRHPVPALTSFARVVLRRP
ncbi:class I SAM-dependent methyltransferase [Vallicoccus soli]|nr:methyltransferase domain-containing protein [Vallicoccus soli]